MQIRIATNLAWTTASAAILAGAAMVLPEAALAAGEAGAKGAFPPFLEADHRPDQNQRRPLDRVFGKLRRDIGERARDDPLIEP